MFRNNDGTENIMKVSLEIVARLCCAANREWNLANLDPVPVNWTNSSKETKEGYLDMVQIFAHGGTEREVHVQFLKVKKERGWVLGSYHSDTKQHPYLMPFDELDERLKLKYTLYQNIVKSFL